MGDFAGDFGWLVFTESSVRKLVSQQINEFRNKKC